MSWRAINGTILVVVLFAAVTSSHSPSDAAESDEPADFPNLDGTQEFRLTVVGPGGKPVPNVELKIRLRPKLEPHHVLRGEFVRARGEGSVDAKADEEGRLVVVLPPNPNLFTVHIEHPGYAPYWAQWDSRDGQEEVPAELTAKLDAGWIVGGIVVDNAGKRIEGVEISVSSIKFKKRPGDLQELHVGHTVKTAADGSWKYACVPDSMKELVVAFNHDKYMPQRPSLSRSAFEIKGDGKPTAKIELEPGLTVMGRVMDEAGQPIAGALVRTKFLNDRREASTNEDGEYRLMGCEPRMTRIVVSASGKALDLKIVRVESEMEPVNFTMKPGGHLRVVALNEQGKPIPKTRIFFQRWRGPIDYFEFDHISDYADENGVWEWNEAPHDEIKADICRPGGMQLVERSLVAREEEFVFRPPAELVVNGTVTDAETKKPIKNYRVVQGIRTQRNGPSLQWFRNEVQVVTNSRYTIRQNREYPAHLVRVEANGYQAAVSRDIKSDEGSITIDFALRRGKDIAATVLTPDGQPAAGAKIALGVIGSQISVENGDIDDGSTYHASRLNADDSGRFEFPPQDTNFQIVITHPTGYAYVKATPDSAPSTIQLDAWAKVAGVFRAGPDPAANVKLDLNSNAIDSYGDDVPHIFTSYQTTTGLGGKFSFDRVFPGDGWVGRNILLMVDDGATEVTSSKRVKTEFRAGETTQLDVGGDGVQVVGRLAPPLHHKEKVLWNFALVNAQVQLAPVKPLPVPAAVQNDAKRRQAWWNEFRNTEEGKVWTGIYEANERIRKTSPYFTATVDRDGSFHIDDVPPGSYSLDVRFDQHPAGQLRDYKFTVPKNGSDPSDVPFDLGVLQLE